MLHGEEQSLERSTINAGVEEGKLVIFPELSGVANVLKPINLQKAARYAFVFIPLLH